MTAPPETRQDIFRLGLRRILRPLAKAMIAHGVTAPAFYRILKEVMVEVAAEEFAIDGRPPTDSRVSVLTGVHRRDVRTIREAGAGPAPARPQVTAMASVVGRWLADPELAGPDGSPRPLPRQAEEGPSFEALVRRISTDIRPRTVLDELLRQGLVTADPATGALHLDAGAVLGPAEDAQQLHFYARNLADHTAAATENLLAPPGEAPFLERAVFYNRLSAASVAELEAEARARGRALLTDLNRAAWERQCRDADDAEAGLRFRFGVFFYRGADDDSVDRAEPGGRGDEHERD